MLTPNSVRAKRIVEGVRVVRGWPIFFLTSIMWSFFSA
jgi:hypothetical protein